MDASRHTATLDSGRRGDERRSSVAAIHWPERRRGFDRRRRQSVTRFLQENTTILVALVVVLNVLNVLDLALTSRALSLGALEANPIMRAAFADGWQMAALVKVGSMLIISAAIVWGRRYRRVLQLAVATVLAYSVLIGYHLFGAALIA